MKNLILALACIFFSLHATLAQPPAPTQTPANARSGQEVSFTTTVSNHAVAGLVVSWQYRPPTGIGLDIVINSDSPYEIASSGDQYTLKIKGASLNASFNGYQFRVRTQIGAAEPVYGAYSDELLLDQPPAPTQTPANVRSGQEVSFRTTVSNYAIAGIAIFWQYRQPSAGADWANIPPNGEASPYETSSSGAQYTLKIKSTHVNSSDFNGYQFHVRTQIGTSPSYIVDGFPSAALQVEPPATPAQSPANPCAGGEATFTTTALAGAAVYRWEYAASGDNWVTAETAAAGLTFEKTNTGENYSLKKSNLAVSHNGYRFRAFIRTEYCPIVALSGIHATAPVLGVITGQAPACAGGEFSFTAPIASGCLGEYRYVWKCDNADITAAGTSPAYSDYTTSVLKITNYSVADAAKRYTCVLRKAGADVTANSVQLAINSPITQQPSSKDVCPGGNTSFDAVIANPGGCTVGFQWQHRAQANANADQGWENITGQTAGHPTYRDFTSASLKVNGVLASHNGYQYRLRISFGALTFSSAPATLTVNQPPSINAPSDQTVCAGSNLSFSVVVTSVTACSFDYQWQSRASATADWADVGNAAPYSGAAEAELRIANVPVAYNARQYRCLLKSNGMIIAESTPASLTVNAVTLTPLSNQTVCLGDRAVFSIPVSNRPCISAYKWQYRANADAAWADVNMTPPSAYSAGEENSTFSLTISSSAVAHNGQYRCLFTAASGEM